MATTFREPDAAAAACASGSGTLHVSDLVDGLTAFYARRRRSAQRASRGSRRCCTGTGAFSSRKRKLEEDAAFRVLGARNFPSHRTPCEFRRRHLEDFKGLFVEVVRVARGLRILGNCR